MRHLKSIDAIRALAVLLVVVWHYFPRKPHSGAIGILQHLLIPTGPFAVTLFFVLSGFLITAILLRDKESSPDKNLVVRHFMIRRALRILPVYFLLMVLLILLDYPFYENEIPYQLSFTSNHFVFNVGNWTEFGHTWSLSVEEQFYLIWPWIIIFISNRTQQYVFYGCIVLSLISVWYFMCPNVFDCENPRFTHTTSNLAAFATGGIYASLWRTPVGQAKIRSYIKYLFPISLIVYFYFRVSILTRVAPQMFFTTRLVDALVSIGIIHYIMALQKGPVKKYFIDNRYVSLLGRMSYGVYLFHIPIRYYYEQLLSPYQSALNFRGSQYLTFLPYFAIVIIVSYLSYQFFERKILAVKQKFSFDVLRVEIANQNLMLYEGNIDPVLPAFPNYGPDRTEKENGADSRSDL